MQTSETTIVEQKAEALQLTINVKSASLGSEHTAALLMLCVRSPTKYFKDHRTIPKDAVVLSDRLPRSPKDLQRSTHKKNQVRLKGEVNEQDTPCKFFFLASGACEGDSLQMEPHTR